jgi:hypothetical protein
MLLSFTASIMSVVTVHCLAVIFIINHHWILGLVFSNVEKRHGAARARVLT